MKNTEIFEKLFWEVGAKHNLTNWYEIFDSEVFNEVATEICKYFNATLPSHVEGYLDWYNEMYYEL